MFDPKRYGDFNILVTSDLHVGIGLMASRPPWQQLLKLTRAFVKFLDDHRQTRVGGRPWKLVLNGDFIDFIQVVLPPSALGMAGSVDESRFGAEAHDESSDRKLAHILRRHRAISRALARFVAAGNMLLCVAGNHDVDFNFRSVRNTFRNHLADLARAEHRRGAQALERLGQTAASRRVIDDHASKRAFCKRIRFYSWFYFEPGLFIEHGHQYDPYSSFHYTFDPVDDAGRIDLPASHRVLYYAADRLGIDTAGTDAMSLWDFFRWASTKGLRGMWRLASVYYDIVVRSVLRKVRLSLRAAIVHESAIAEVARATGLPLADVRRLDRLRARPAQGSVYEMLSMLYVDRLAAGGAAMAGVAASFFFLPNGAASYGTALGIAGACALLQVFLSYRRQSSTVPKLASVARRIAPLLGVKNVVFGHSHYPVAETIGPARYFNTGSFWAPTAEGGKRGVNYVRFVRDEDGELCATSEFAIAAPPG